MHPFTSHSSGSVSALGEERLIGAIRRWLGAASPRAPFGIGDDCAVLPAGHGRQLLTVDPVIYRNHFDDAVPARDVGAKLLKRNLSDLGAMGGRPTAAVVALTLDPRVSLKWLEQFHRGLAACARKYRVPIVGGDITQAKGVIVASLTLLGEMAAKRVVTRTGARVGDRIYVTGRLGGSLRSRHHYTFTPRLAEGAWLANCPAVRAMMDVSDGLAKDLKALMPRGAVAALQGAAIPRRAGVSLAQALSDGEDYELVLAVSAAANHTALERAWRRTFPRTPLTCIGQFAAPRDRPPGSLDLAKFSGYEHLKP